MSILDFITSFFDSESEFTLDYDDPVYGTNEIAFSKYEFLGYLNHTPNLHEEHLNQILEEGDIESISPHLDGALGNMIAQKYFANLGAVVEPEVHSDNGIIDMIVSPSYSMQMIKILPGNDGIELETTSLDDQFAIEIKNYGVNSFHQTNLQDIGNQIQNGSHVAGHSYLGVTKDFLHLDWDTQKEIIDIAKSNGDGIILLPYNKMSLDDTLNNLLDQLY
ncbi:MAG: hypothetical protein WCJ01_10315 [Ignavibacteria bacterium]